MIAQDIEKVLLSEEEIENRRVELAHQIEADYKESGDVPIVVGLLKGSVPFMAELIKRFESVSYTRLTLPTKIAV